MGYNLLLKMQGVRVGSAGRGSLRPLFNPRLPGARAHLAYPGLVPMVGPRYVGDPGIFGAIGKFVGGVARHVVQSIPIVGGVERGIEAGIAAMKGTQRIGTPQSRALPNIGPTVPQYFGGGDTGYAGSGTGPSAGGDVAGGDESIPAQNVAVVTTRHGSTALVPTSGNVCGIKGYHLNKSGYYRNDSALLPGAHYVAKGTMCVKNRRMNPFNPRAASKAMHRLHSLAAGMKGLKKSIAKLSREAGVHHAAPRHAFAKKR